MRKNNNKKSKRNRTPANNRAERSLHLPVLNTNVVVKHKYRFIATAVSTNAVITSNNLLSCAGVMGTVIATTVSMIFASGRLRQVEVWGGGAAAGTGSTVSVEWTGAGNSPNLEYSDSTISAANPAHLRLTPPKNTLASFWQLSTASVNMFQITCPAGTVVDVTLDLILSDTGAATTTIAGFAGSVVGQMFYLALDGRATNNFVPVRLSTTS